jgi:hypothetical protein
MKKIFFITALALSQICFAQTDEEKVAARIQSLFTSMFNGDSLGVRNCFMDNAIMQTIGTDKTGKSVVQTGSLDAFSSFVGKQTKGVADERIKFDGIKIDGDMAMVWTPYEFYYQQKFSHCGVNSFMLFRKDGEWKINYIIDTRRKEGCK